MVTKDHQRFHKIQQQKIVILGYQTSFEGNKTSNTPFLISSQSHSLTSPNSTHIPETIQSCQLSENSFAQTFYDQNNSSQFNQHQQTHMPLILPRLQNDLFPCLNLRPDNIYTQQGKTLLTTPTIPPTASNSLLSPQTSNWSSSSSPYQYELIFLPASVSKCYGCSQSFAEKYRHPPYNIVVKHKDRRIRGVDTNGNIRYSSDFQNTYYHLNHEHILKKNPSFDRKIFIRDRVKTNLSQEHVKYLNKSSFIFNLYFMRLNFFSYICYIWLYPIISLE